MQSLQQERVKEWFARGQYHQLNGQSIFTIDEGEQHLPCIVLIHGFPTSSFDFLDIWPSLSGRFRLISLDMLGFGFSDKPNKRNYTIAKQADLFEPLLQKLGVKQCHILAHDYGVSVAQELLSRQHKGLADTKFLSCCFLNGGLFPETHRALLIQKLMLSPLGKWINKLTGFKQFSASFSSVFGAHTKPNERELKEFWEIINFNQGRHLFHNLITYILDRRLFREQWLIALQSSDAPLALINGNVDPVSGIHLVDRYKELNCRLDYLKHLPTIGHYPQVEDPSGVSSAYLEFLQEVM